jgi:uncharacterized protein (DUF433 family)
MVETTIHYPHITDNAEKKAVIKGTNLKVSELVTFHLAYGWGAEELYLHFPYLSLGKIYSALSYYYDHEEIIEEEIRVEVNFVENLKSKYTPSAILLNKVKHQRNLWQ